MMLIFNLSYYTSQNDFDHANHFSCFLVVFFVTRKGDGLIIQAEAAVAEGSKEEAANWLVGELQAAEGDNLTIGNQTGEATIPVFGMSVITVMYFFGSVFSSVSPLLMRFVCCFPVYSSLSVVFLSTVPCLLSFCHNSLVVVFLSVVFCLLSSIPGMLSSYLQFPVSCL
ncbi:hypothetical protein BaRGS_00013238 [Batillaria attramentaria]|uniref:Uncharacterized protein n=1 Tax=Batillaria attramentaria TaxID=370345 RepID=A0ABD0L8D4_9CAEN